MHAQETQDVDEEERLLESEREETSGDETLRGTGRSWGRISVMALGGAAALACVLGVSGAVGSRTRLRQADGFLEEEGLRGDGGRQVSDAEIYATTTAQPTATVVSRYGQQIFDANMMSLAPKENKNDGNLCGEDEEEFEKGCYKKCALLTNGEAAHRTSPFSCCPKPHCGFRDERINVRVCSGYDVAGDEEGKGKCPHQEGVCLADEEIHLGMCYKKCSELTKGEYEHRTSALTCCKFSPDNLHNVVKCLDPWNTDTSLAYSVGGGAGDGDKSTPSKPHAPMTALTETSEST